MDGSLIGCNEVHKQLLEKLIFASTDAEVLISGPNGIGRVSSISQGQIEWTIAVAMITSTVIIL